MLLLFAISIIIDRSYRSDKHRESSYIIHIISCRYLLICVLAVSYKLVSTLGDRVELMLRLGPGYFGTARGPKARHGPTVGGPGWHDSMSHAVPGQII